MDAAINSVIVHLSSMVGIFLRFSISTRKAHIKSDQRYNKIIYYIHVRHTQSHALCV